MGQGTESCGGYECYYDEYEDGLTEGLWTQRDGSTIKVSKMTVKHLNGARQVCARAAYASSFYDEREKWESWVDIFENELQRRGEPFYHDDDYGGDRKPAKYTSPEAVKKTRGCKVEMICHCGRHYEARQADLNRGYGLSCSKSCSGKRRELRLPAATKAK